MLVKEAINVQIVKMMHMLYLTPQELIAFISKKWVFHFLHIVSKIRAIIYKQNQYAYKHLKYILGEDLFANRAVYMHCSVTRDPV